MHTGGAMPGDGSDDGFILYGMYPLYGPYTDKDTARQYWKITSKLRAKNGKVVTRSTREYSQEEAKKLHTALTARIQAGYEAPPTAEATIGELLEVWRASEKTTKPLTPNRLAGIQYVESNLLQMFQGIVPTMPLKRAARRILQNYEAWKDAPHQTKGVPKSPRTKAKVRAILTRFFHQALLKKWLHDNPMSSLRHLPERAPVPARTRLTFGESLRLWAYCKSMVLARTVRRRHGRKSGIEGQIHWHVGVQVALMLGCGLRIGEVQDALVRGLDRPRPGQDVLRLFDGKTSNAARTIPLFECPWLLAAIKEIAQGKSAVETIFHPMRRSKEALTHSMLSGGLARTCKLAGVTSVACHALRRTFADLREEVSNQALKNFGRAIGRAQMGHAAGSNVMEKAYLSPESQRNASTLEVGSVLKFLDCGGDEERSEQGPAPVSPDEKLRELVAQCGGVEQARRTLENLFSGGFPGGTPDGSQPRKI